MGRHGDMIANLTRLPDCIAVEGVEIKQAYTTDKNRVMDFIREHFQEGWALEAEYAMMQSPRKCFIAVENKQVIGFACYDTTAKGFFGPIGVAQSERGRKLGEALLLRTLHAMREFGYGYAIIGWVGPAENFYRKVVNAEWIDGGEPENSVYWNMIDM